MEERKKILKERYAFLHVTDESSFEMPDPACSTSTESSKEDEGEKLPSLQEYFKVTRPYMRKELPHLFKNEKIVL